MKKEFQLRTSFAGVDVSRKVLKSSQDIAKKFKSFEVLWTSDKSVGCEMDSVEFSMFKRDHEAMKIAYLID